ncbi:MAG: hypothetical protein JWN49_47 [Parcubacteria group bacterium]|nr:hypothetical protein [Parcubacteria group bacterium]
MIDNQVLTPGITRELNGALARNGWTTAMVKQLIAGNRLAELRTQQFPPYGELLPLTVGGRRTKGDLIEAGCYDEVDGIAKDFLFGSKGLLIKTDFVQIDGQPRDLRFDLISFGRDMSTSQVLAEFERRGAIRPEREDVLWFGEKYPELQRENRIPFLHKPMSDQWERDGGDYWVFVLDTREVPRDRKRIRRLTCRASDTTTWGPECRFPVRYP